MPAPTSYGEGGTCTGVAELLERERERQPAVWLDAGDFTVGPAFPLLGERPWADMAELPIAAAAAGNHEFDDGVPALWRRPPCCPTRCSAPTSTSACRPPRWSGPAGRGRPAVGRRGRPDRRRALPDAWAGELAGTPAGHAHVFAAPVLVVDLPGHDRVWWNWSRMPSG